MKMSRFWLLTKVQLLSLFGINKALHSGRAKDRSRLILVCVAAFAALAYFGWIGYAVSSSTAEVIMSVDPSRLSVVVSSMMLRTTIVILITGVYRGGQTLFKYKDYDMVMSMPVSTAAVAGSRIVMLYVFDMVFTIVLMLPATIVYGQFTGGGIAYYLVNIMQMLFVPIVPLVISAIVGTLVTSFASKFSRLGNAVNIILTLIFVVAVIGVSFLLPGSNGNLFSLISDEAGLGRFYPLNSIYTRSVCELDLLSTLAFPLISLAVFSLFCVIVATRYRSISSRIASGGAKARGLAAKDIRSRGVVSSLYRRELRMYTSSTIYVVNTAVGVVMAIVFTAVIAIKGGIPAMGDMPAEATDMINSYIVRICPFVISMLVSMSCTTGSSISIEGKSFWILKTLPVSARNIFIPKILVNLTLTIPACLICAAFMGVGLNLSGFYLISTFAFPLVFSVFSAVLGIFINLCIPKLEWQNEAQVVKQSAASMLSMFAPMLYCIIAIVITGTTDGSPVIATTVLMALPIAVLAVLSLILVSNGDKMMSGIS